MTYIKSNLSRLAGGLIIASAIAFQVAFAGIAYGAAVENPQNVQACPVSMQSPWAWYSVAEGTYTYDEEGYDITGTFHRRPSCAEQRQGDNSGRLWLAIRG